MKNLFNRFLIFYCLSLPYTVETKAENLEHKDITELDMKDLLNVQVTSVSKKAQALSDAPSAIYVISQEDIRRSGVTSIPEALRMAPGIDVARINSSKWAITSRGFNGTNANKLLVLIDGRAVYTPAFSGVYWDAQDVLLEDVDRIEVIRGPGATLWGSNAVNGVINVITKRVEETQGALVSAGGGTLETGFGSARYGAKLAEDTYGRAYVKGFVRDSFKPAEGTEKSGDNWDRVQGGFRVDSRLSNQDELTLQGDAYQSRLNQRVSIPIFTRPYRQLVYDTGYNEGWNFLSKLTHNFSSTSQYVLQFYYDHTKRKESLIEQSLDTLDIDFQHNFELMDNHNFIWGLGYRTNLDKFINNENVSLTPSKRNTQLFSAFLQDEISLIENKLWLNIGSKFEHNDFTGFEGQPSARLLWAPTSRQRLWAAFSRSVRTPSRAEHNVQVHRSVFDNPNTPTGFPPVAISVNGNPSYRAEVQLAYELGYRLALTEKASLDFTAFYNEYNQLRSVAPGRLKLEGFPPQIHFDQPLLFNNKAKAKTYGFEAASVWQMTDWWRWEANYSFLQTRIYDSIESIKPKSPQHKINFRSLINPIDNIDLDFWFRYTGNATAIKPTVGFASASQAIKDYFTFDIRLAWRPKPGLELSLTGQNLFADKHLEYTDEISALPTVIPRSVYGKISLEF